MSPPRLRDTEPADRALLESEPPLPPGLQERVWRDVHERLSTHRRSWRWWVLAGGLLASTAAAATGWRWLETPALEPPPAPVVGLPRAPTPELAPPPAPPSEPAPTRAATVPRPPERRPLAVERPALARPPLATAPPPPAPPPSRLTIERAGRTPIHLDVGGDGAVTGEVRGVPVRFSLDGARLEGSIGADGVSIWMRGERASGRLAGHEVGFVLTPTARGHVVRGAVPSHTVRVEHDEGALSWLPGCPRALPAIRPGVHEGECPDGVRTRVTLPPAVLALPPLARLMILGVLLTERDPMLESEWPPPLFPAER